MSNNLFLENKLLQQQEYKDRKTTLSSYPSIIRIPVSDKCNLKCFMCQIAYSFDAFKISITPEGYKRIEMLYPYLERLALSGAEVFTVKEGTGNIIDKIISDSENFPDMKLIATSNGQLIDGNRAELIVNKFGILNISLDTPNPAVYESIRIGGKFDVLINNLKYINKLKKQAGRTAKDKPHLQFSVLVMKRTYKDLARLVDLVSELGGYTFGLMPIQPYISAEFWKKISDEDIFTDSNKVKEYIGILEEVKRRCTKHNIILLDRTSASIRKCSPDLLDSLTMENYDITEKSNILNKSETPLVSWPVCIYPWRNLHIDSNGSVHFACCSNRVIGNINNQTIAEIYNSPEAIDERLRFIDGNYENCHLNCQMGYAFAGTKIKKQRKEKEIAEKNLQLIDKDRQIYAVFNTMSWKITKPLRFIFSLFK